MSDSGLRAPAKAAGAALKCRSVRALALGRRLLLARGEPLLGQAGGENRDPGQRHDAAPTDGAADLEPDRDHPGVEPVGGLAGRELEARTLDIAAARQRARDGRD